METMTPEFYAYMYGYDTMPPSDDDAVKTIGEILAGTDDDRRLPVLNREPRELMSKQKYALILARDGRGCRYCYDGNGGIQIDHIVPRSAFGADYIDVADRSDNLTVACVDCNQQKSNRDYGYAKRPGVTPACWDCLNPAPDPDADYDAYEAWCDVAAVNRNHIVYCGRCGMGAAVPDLSWVL